MFGPKSERTREKVYFEKGEVKRVNPLDRAYPMGQTVQRTRKVEAPVAAAKVYNGELTANQIMQKEFLQVCRKVYLTKRL